MIDSTASLVGSDAHHFELLLQNFPIWQRYMHEDNPVTGHPEFELCLVAPRSNFLRIPKHWDHARMRHICLQRDASPGYGFSSGVGHIENNLG